MEKSVSLTATDNVIVIMAIRFRTYFLLILLLVSGATHTQAQRSQILSERIHTLQVLKNNDWQDLPVIKLGSDDRIVISFDEMSHQYQRLTYTIRHCKADWTESGLLESDFLDGFNGQPIDDFENSINTTFLYTHYTLQLPNDDVSLLVSGNYEVTITDDNNGDELIKARFAIMEDGAIVGTSVSGNTDIDTNLHNQQLDITVNYSALPVSDPESEIIVLATQNRRNDIMVSNLRPTHITPSQMQFSHNRSLIFPGGNEFRRFEIINMYDYTQNVDRIDFFDPYFHAMLFQDSPRREYRYDEDHNGRYLVRYNKADINEIEADYLLVHFTLKAPRYSGGTLYLDGDFTDGVFSDRWKMKYNDQTGCYENTAVLKMGSYDYRYLWVPEGSKKGQTARTEGDSYETANEYQVFVWFRQRGLRYDRLVGLSDLRMSR